MFLIVFAFVSISVYGQGSSAKWTTIKGKMNSYSYSYHIDSVRIPAVKAPYEKDTAMMEVSFKNDAKSCKHLAIEVEGSVKGKSNKMNYDIYLKGNGATTTNGTLGLKGAMVSFPYDKINSIKIISEEDSDKCK